MKNYLSDGLRPLQNPHLWHISSLCAARKLAYLSDMSALSALL
ncbi:lipoprotein signal peptidase [Neisseria sp. N95_16]|nr:MULTISPECIES: lipoprotein signal peptidase [Neisseria]PJO08999.1 lipoprotein signal peptidase [Neisseria sp. N95_16]PJO79019.1 lipoprotein signal peptidase [Neisseria sp. N177_16]